jgi:hypothetical protein
MIKSRILPIELDEPQNLPMSKPFQSEALKAISISIHPNKNSNVTIPIFKRTT